MCALTAVPLDDPAFRGRDLEVWRIDLDASREPSADILSDLDAAERARLARFQRVGDRARFAVTRAALRRLLGARLGCEPRAVPIRIDAQGKPGLPGDGLWFNLAHSGDHGLIALSAAGPVGVDIEQARPLDRLDALAGTILSDAEQAVWAVAAPVARPALFLRVWTLKEAVLKAVGTGLLADPRGLSVLQDDGRSLCLANALPGGGSAAILARPLAAVPGYAAALALVEYG